MNLLLRLAMATVAVSLLATLAAIWILTPLDGPDGSHAPAAEAAPSIERLTPAAVIETQHAFSNYGSGASAALPPSHESPAAAAQPASETAHVTESAVPVAARVAVAESPSSSGTDPDPPVQQAQFVETERADRTAAEPEPVRSSVAGGDRPERVAMRTDWPRLGGSRKEDVIEFQNDDLAYALHLLAEASGRKILTSPGVKGSITLSLRNADASDVLDKVLKTNGLVCRREGNYTLVYTPEELRDAEKLGHEVGIRVYQPQFISAIDLKELLTVHLSDTGKISSTKSNEIGIAANSDTVGGDHLAVGDVLVVQDIEPVLEKLDKIVQQVDVRPPQVLIEAVLLSVVLDDEHKMGVNFALLSSTEALSVSGNGLTLNGAAGFPPSTLVTPTGKVQGAFADNSHGLKFGVIEGDFTGFIRLLETIGQTTILASPKVVVLNKQRAEMIVGSRLGYRTLTVTETQAVENIEFLDLGTQLRVRPFIQPDGRIRMELHPEKSSGQINPETELPEEDTASVTTNLTIRDGMTIVIGGLIEEQQERTVQQVPLLGSLPYVGPLFRDETTKTARSELIVLVTPHILDEDVAAEEACQEVARFRDRRDGMEQSLPRHTRSALARKYFEKACACRAQGNIQAALEAAELSLHFNPLEDAARRLARELRSAGGETAAVLPSEPPVLGPEISARTKQLNSAPTAPKPPPTATSPPRAAKASTARVQSPTRR